MSRRNQLMLTDEEYVAIWRLRGVPMRTDKTIHFYDLFQAEEYVYNNRIIKDEEKEAVDNLLLTVLSYMAKYPHADWNMKLKEMEEILKVKL